MIAARILAPCAPTFWRENRAAPRVSCTCASVMPKRSTPAPTQDSISCGICASVHSGDRYGIGLCRDRPLDGSSAGMELDGRHDGAGIIARYCALQFSRVVYDPTTRIRLNLGIGKPPWG